jgi:hypothetical protein
MPDRTGRISLRLNRKMDCSRPCAFSWVNAKPKYCRLEAYAGHIGALLGGMTINGAGRRGVNSRRSDGSYFVVRMLITF